MIWTTQRIFGRWLSGVFNNNKNVNFGHSDAVAYSQNPSIRAGVLEYLANSQADGLGLGRRI
ncbi:hypothetical protein BOTCAL_0533g00010 [Botryotinia calthae]|uniref:Uncharacterized protein n=1 Tax=Botryotinia calthae TaxID=38488 RepID=A0A4Y8CKI8_9HELO|nr:hypothetical protein BOTCAL_0533g00010 [Botryotinia calthae]